MSLDLDQWEIEAKEQNFNWEEEYELSDRILTLISELREANQILKLCPVDFESLLKRLRCAEEALRFYADNQMLNDGTWIKSLGAYGGEKAREHFQKFKKIDPTCHVKR